MFNRALLARQGWRLLQYLNSLICQFFKGKYFQNQYLLEATVKSNSSFIWRSICKSKGVLVVGMRWRVGTGDQIRIWKDLWLGGSQTLRC
jgi:hypothetical protein